MYELSQAAAQDIEAILDRSIIDFGPIHTERYFESLSRCLGLLSENPGMGRAADETRPGYRRFGH
ncbi:MAG: type II toxin-antitoxin system RelE/ParE family toxin [Lamprocystis purpurea]|jgi:plasmid stabilization system protein ParE|uniref:type II toxin-antitoxin system RelE/ParE family toxin n=1 Tax=Lamprocystis purpurea TaxID=61598 RepID=UPI00036DE6A8|nr:type II toxin-antitoxin system RelE/ParE family toxin [Lamprocystis purpurea]MBV5274098.1 type II toxin-antitoxin system RelE/ParE family toxin [Lamprocystis purpurea]